ncbi:putative HTH-type transcriptional regulator YfiR [compost metagenome]
MRCPPKVSDQHKEQRRLEILQAAKRVFKRKGYERATMSDIVSESGLSRGGVYWHFSDKEALLTALFEHLSQQLVQDVSSLAQRHPSAWSALEAFIEGSKQDVLRQSDDPDAASVVEFFVSGWRDENRRRFAVGRYQQGTEQLRLLVQHGVESGEFRPRVEPMTIVQGMVSFLDALHQSTFFLGPGILDIEGHIALVKDFLRYSLGIQASPPEGLPHP